MAHATKTATYYRIAARKLLKDAIEAMFSDDLDRANRLINEAQVQMGRIEITQIREAEEDDGR